MRKLALLVSVLTMVMVTACSSGQKPPMYEPPRQEEMGAVSSPTLPPIYRIDYGDELKLRFLYHDELDAVVIVRPDGQVSLPGLGDFYAAGLSLDELETDVTRRASITHRNPVVSILVTDYAPRMVYVGGHVRDPGYVRMRPGLTSLRAVYERGGFRNTARMDSVLHIEWDATGGYAAKRIDLSNVLSSGDTSQDLALSANDVVYVPSTWVADAGVFVEQWIRNLIPIREPSTGFQRWDP